MSSCFFRLMKFVVGASLFISGTAYAPEPGRFTVDTTIPIDMLTGTQPYISNEIVDAKISELLSGERPRIPVHQRVVNGQVVNYVLDHHHTATGYARLGHTEVPVRVVGSGYWQVYPGVMGDDLGPPGNWPLEAGSFPGDGSLMRPEAGEPCGDPRGIRQQLPASSNVSDRPGGSVGGTCGPSRPRFSVGPLGRASRIAGPIGAIAGVVYSEEAQRGNLPLPPEPVLDFMERYGEVSSAEYYGRRTSENWLYAPCYAIAAGTEALGNCVSTAYGSGRDVVTGAIEAAHDMKADMTASAGQIGRGEIGGPFRGAGYYRTGSGSLQYLNANGSERCY